MPSARGTATTKPTNTVADSGRVSVYFCSVCQIVTDLKRRTCGARECVREHTRHSAAYPEPALPRKAKGPEAGTHRGFGSAGRLSTARLKPLGAVAVGARWG